ncbi:hypothetical protein ACWET9_22630 [Streptomyces sp. NPDC004059]
MTDRISLNDMTSDQLDQLYDERDRLRAQLADMTSDRDRWKWYRDDAERRVRVQRERADRAEAAIARARALHQPVGVVAATEFGNPPDCAICGPNTWPCPTYNAITDDQPTPTAATPATD